MVTVIKPAHHRASRSAAAHLVPQQPAKEFGCAPHLSPLYDTIFPTLVSCKNNMSEPATPPAQAFARQRDCGFTETGIPCEWDES
ncbi:hypothetical protein EV126DRAFT_429185 [Verticillium dahliae]|nr:hypothetical protein EV126DRAFT_429185 [Verticillium dahliae]